MERLLSLIHEPGVENWKERCTQAFEELFGVGSGRYPEKARSTVSIRAPGFKEDSGVAFAGLIHPSNPDSGPYGGMSFVIFPSKDAPCLVAMGIGTQGLSPDEDVLGRPGHARKVQAICSWLNKQYGKSKMVAWAKQDPVRTDIDVPDNIKKLFAQYTPVFQRYGRVLYGIFAPDQNRSATKDAVSAFLDLNFEERSHYPLTAYKDDSERIRSGCFEHLMPDLKESQIISLLKDRRFVIIQGPPGTGKTEMAARILSSHYSSNGFSVQFHPNTTYENFVGGLAPEQSKDQLGLRFQPTMGFLMKAAEAALSNPSKPFLLCVDEINRADLAKVLGEAIYLFEAKPLSSREITLAHDFGGRFGVKLRLPDNLHILGTMNTADRSIAIVDVAVRRRFAFVKLWPQYRVVKENGGKIMQDAFEKLLSIFVEHADNDAFDLVPGHSYFLEADDTRAAGFLKVHLVPLLEEYLAQGYVASFSNHIRGYLQWIDSL